MRKSFLHSGIKVHILLLLTIFLSSCSLPSAPIHQEQAQAEIQQFMLDYFIQSHIHWKTAYQTSKANAEDVNQNGSPVWIIQIPDCESCEAGGEVADYAHPMKMWTFENGQLVEMSNAETAFTNYS
jgi:hypothetical protein